MSDALSYVIPQHEKPIFWSLPAAVQREVHFALKALFRISRAKKVREAVKREVRAAKSMGLRRGFGESSLDRKRKAYRDSGGDWIVLIDQAKVPDWDRELRCRVREHEVALPPEFVSHYRGLCMERTRSSRQAHYKLVRAWRAGESIPGYGTWREWWLREQPGRPLPATCPEDVPDGWSYANLMRYAPDRTVLTLARHGIAAAKETLPTIVRTRKGLLPMQYIVLDDWRCDWRCCVPGVAEPCMLNGILAMDVATAVCLRFGVRPALPRENGSHEGLKRIDAKSIVASILLTYGYPLDYRCTIIVERGTATITPEDAAAIEEITGGRVRVTWTSMISGRVFGYADRPVGNFRGKAWLESFFNLLHNACADIPGQIGAHYSKMPAEIEGRTKMHKALTKAQAVVPEQLRNVIEYRMPFPSPEVSRDSLNTVFHMLNNRDRHALEGFDQVMQFRLGKYEDWVPAQRLIELGVDPEVIERLPCKPRPETPMERLRRLSRDVRFERVHQAAAPRLLETHRQVVIEKEGEVNIGSSSKPVYYRDLRNPYLRPRARYLAYINSQDDEWIHLTDGKGAYVTSVRKERAVSQADPEATSRAIAEHQAQLKRKLAEARKYDLTSARALQDARHNLEQAQKAEAINLVEREAQSEGECTLVAAQVQAACNGVSAARREVEDEAAEAAARRRRYRDDFHALDSRPDEASEQEEYAVSMDELNEL